MREGVGSVDRGLDRDELNVTSLWFGGTLTTEALRYTEMHRERQRRKIESRHPPVAGTDTAGAHSSFEWREI
jgi:hypothetical protein